MAKSSKRLELGRASYSVQQMGDELMLFASGVHPTSGFREFFETVTLEGSIAEFKFLFIQPEREEEGEKAEISVVAHMATAFQHHERFRVRGQVQGVVIQDRDGRHELIVERFPGEAERDRELEEEAPETEALAAAAAAPLQAALICDDCVRQVIIEWAGNNAFNNSQTLGQIYRRGSCNNGVLSQLFQAIQQRCGHTPLSFSCNTTVRQLIRSTCP